MGAHGGQIACGAGEGAITDRLGRMRVEAEMDVFEGEGGAAPPIVSGAGAQAGGVVTDAEPKRGRAAAPAGGEAPGNALDQFVFG